MKVVENSQAPENTVIKAAAAECDAKTAALRQLLDPIEIACATRARIAQMPFSTPDREREAAREVESRSKLIDELIRSGADLHTIRRAVGEMEENCRRLAIPEKTPSFEEEIARMEPVLRNASWMPEEIDALARVWGSGGRINTVTIKSVKVGGREILRSEVRKKLAGDVAEASERQEREALELEAENKERKARGEPTRHREW
ncbi:MAG: hypothetical protein WCE23_16555 [Candidatus Binatus sp.]|uniref:hypothetical protein n=1 Tax=Candidatus Binatus sp. TaxID=2811406 RepID=UPI003C755B68